MRNSSLKQNCSSDFDKVTIFRFSYPQFVEGHEHKLFDEECQEEPKSFEHKVFDEKCHKEPKSFEFM